jgi:hypothetical protein
MQVCSNKGPIQSGNNHKNVKIGWGLLEIFSRTTGPILTRLSTYHPTIEGIQVYSLERDCLFPRGCNCKRVKIH